MTHIDNNALFYGDIDFHDYIYILRKFISYKIYLKKGKITMKVKNYPIDNEYIIDWQSELGVGINGKVKSCVNKKTKENYALKILKDGHKARQEIELHLLVSQHPNIVKIYDVFGNNIGGINYLLVIMELMMGGELFERIQKKICNGFTEKEASEVVCKICHIVSYLHDMDIAHRDIKPENLLFTNENETSILKLTDFGFAKRCSTEDEVSLETPCYTPFYVAPEVLSSSKYCKSCDVWSIGIITYILLCGYPPFYSTNGQPISPGMKARIREGQFDFPAPEWDMVSAVAKDFIKKLLEIDPNTRLTVKEALEHKWIKHFNKIPFIFEVDKNFDNKIEWHKIIDQNSDDDDETSQKKSVKREVQLKSLPESNNPLFLKRREKKE
ncbi:MAP kinase-activated protein kinase 2 [Strongyloides ratti]|uniref:non-specific serine/threonine protein kinase n=1 Tax=Strongyloides ratti TaxID=34506 RepID=A0A090KUM7_STRRB|nr:MAP kinase-activated protein kinase 2 [Strongyloides ratti]CEF59580.1 MAP kinase-activated protein kinase 2 [Strongyloides ratti]